MSTPNKAAAGWSAPLFGHRGPSITSAVVQSGSPALLQRNFAAAAVRPVPVHFIARLAFWTIFLLSLTNAHGLLMAYIRNVYDENYMLAVYPATFAVCAVLVFAFSRRRAPSAVWIVGWVFWTVYLLGGFLGQEQLTATYYRAVLEVTVKPWISIIGLPWLALRVISLDKLPRFLRATVLVSAIGATFAFLQLALPGFFRNFSGKGDRATGFWVDPNLCGIACSAALFLSLACPFRRMWINWIVRLVLIAAVAASFSRAAIVALILSWIAYGVVSKRFGTVLKTVVVAVLFVVGMFVTLETIEAVSPAQAERLQLVRAFLEGDWAADKTDNRTELWKQAFLAIENKGLIFGLGHGGMIGLRETGGLAPHNYYLLVFGNSGILALLALLAFHFSLFRQGFKCRRRETRASMVAIALMLAVHHMFIDSLIDRPFAGAILACTMVALSVYTRVDDSSLSAADGRASRLGGMALRMVAPGMAPVNHPRSKDSALNGFPPRTRGPS